MGRGVSQASRGIGNRGMKQSRMPVQHLDEFQAGLVEVSYRDFSNWYAMGQQGKSVAILLTIGEKIWENFAHQLSDKPLTKYRYAEAFLRLVGFLTSIEKQTTTRGKDGALLEAYTDWGADPGRPGEMQVVEKTRPWTAQRPKTVTDIPVFSKENIKAVKQCIIHTNPGAIIYDEPVETKTAPVSKPDTKPWGSFFPQVINEEETEKKTRAPEIEGVSVTYRATPRLIKLLTDPSAYDYNLIRTEDLALAIRALSTKKIEPQDARDIANKYLHKYIDSKRNTSGASGEYSFKDVYRRDFDKIKKNIVDTHQFYSGMDKPIDPDSDTKVTIPFFFSAFTVLNLFYDFRVQVDNEIIKQFNGELRRELNAMYQLDKIDEALQKFFQTQERVDFAEVVNCTTRSRYLMVLYLEDDFNHDAAKRTTFFRLWESAVLDDEFPSESRSFFNGIQTRMREIFELVKQDKLEEALDRNRIVFEEFKAIKEKLEAYQRDKHKWGSRALFLMTLAIDLLITYLTAGFTRLIPARAGLLLNLAVPVMKQELYYQMGIIEKRDFVEIGIQAVVNTAATKIATKISSKLIEVYKVPHGSFRSVVMDTLLVNFLSAFQAEIIDSAWKHKDLDDFLKDLFKNFVLGVVHEKCARIAIARARRDGLDAAVKRKDPALLAEPARPVHERLTTRPVPERKPEPATTTSDDTKPKLSASLADDSSATTKPSSGTETVESAASVVKPAGKTEESSVAAKSSDLATEQRGTENTGTVENPVVVTKLTKDGSVLRRTGRNKTKSADDDQNTRPSEEEDDDLSDLEISRRQLQERGTGDNIDTVDDIGTAGTLAQPERAKNSKTFTAQPKYKSPEANWDPSATKNKGITVKPSGRTYDEFHHLIPRELVNRNPKVKALLQKRGINIDDFTVKITQGEHNATHKMNFNIIWKGFFKRKPDATREEILVFKDFMKRRFKLDKYPETPYGVHPPDPPVPPDPPIPGN